MGTPPNLLAGALRELLSSRFSVGRESELRVNAPICIVGNATRRLNRAITRLEAGCDECRPGRSQPGSVERFVIRAQQSPNLLSARLVAHKFLILTQATPSA